MAEARQAVGFKLNVKPDGQIEFDWSSAEAALWVVFSSGVRGLKKRWARTVNSIKTMVFPLKLEFVAANIILLTTVHLAGLDVTFGYTQKIITALCMMVSEGSSCGLWMVSCLLSALFTTAFLVFAIRRSLRCLFKFQGWMFYAREDLKRPPLHFKLWMQCVHILSSLNTFGSKSSQTGKPMLYSYQGALPSLPVPSIKETLQRHLRSMRALVSDSEYDELVELSNEFETSIATRLQRYLWLKWAWSDNYVSDWWEEYVYLSSRAPLMINSNYYGLDCIVKDEPLFKQASRAANLIYMLFNFRRMILKQESEPLMVRRTVPMCSAQYERIFNTTRIPGQKVDRLVHLEDSTHIAVMHRGRFYRFGCYSHGQLYSPRELQAKIQSILDDPTEVVDEAEAQLAVITASERTTWANLRDKSFRRGINRTSLDIIESAAFVVVLDDYEYDYDENDDAKVNEYGKYMLHGKGYDRWFDKSVCAIVGSNGRTGFNVEHSWADAPICAHLMQYCQVQEYTRYGYDVKGDCKGSVVVRPSKPTLLKWDLDEECKKTILSCVQVAKRSIDELQLHVLVHSNYGKGFMKTCRVSPDAYLQMALQLAYYRDTGGRFSLTYEASMTRLFRDGRTETVRPCTKESAIWVKSMEDESISKGEKISLLKQACERHVRLYQEAMVGQGIDRHLFCLYVISKYLEIESPFLTKVLSEPWRLSTSQTPTRDEYKNMGPDLDTVLVCGGGFGPVVDDGYGISYFINGENKIFFHISSSKKCETTDPYKMAKEVEKALHDMKELLA